ncbi:MAG: hypothetical protein NVV60_14275 [Luteimonas sp.]|nr:hypothetical protein [Luteimonas sp.]
MRIGPWLLVAGLGLLCAGVVSSASQAWERKEKPDVQVALDMQGLEAIDVGDARIEKIVLGNQGNPVLRIAPWKWQEQVIGADAVTSKRENDTLRIDVDRAEPGAREVVLRVPARAQRLSGKSLSLHAEAKVGTLRVEAVDMTWNGDVEALDVQLQPGRTQRCGERQIRPGSSAELEKGKVGRLRISIERGRVRLGSGLQFGEAEIHAGPEVRLDVGRIGDLARIRVLPFDGEPSTPGEEIPAAEAASVEAAEAAMVAACVAMDFD